jgi:hypothetical protein
MGGDSLLDRLVPHLNAEAKIVLAVDSAVPLGDAGAVQNGRWTELVKAGTCCGIFSALGRAVNVELSCVRELHDRQRFPSK